MVVLIARFERVRYAKNAVEVTAPLRSDATVSDLVYSMFITFS